MSSTMNTRTKRVVMAGAALTTAVALLSACSSDDSDSTGPSTSASQQAGHHGSASDEAAAAHNEADVEFNTMMIPHHQQAVEMADMVTERTTNPRVRGLADRIRAAQQPEIDQMTGRLKEWGVEAPGASEGAGHGGHDMSGGHAGMPGMMTDDEMKAMTDARGAEFDKLWLEGMIRHHEGAIAMADAELTDGKDEPSKKLAEQIRAAQKAEIDEMKGILGQ